MKKTIIAFVALAFALAFAYFGPLGIKIPSPEEFKSAAAVQPAATAAGKPAKAAAYQKRETYFKLRNAAGGMLDLASYAGKPVFVFFFTENCPYCRKLAGDLVKSGRPHA